MATIKSISPSTREVLGEVEITSNEEIIQKVQSARKALKPWRDLGVAGSSVLFKDGELSIQPRSPFLMIQATGIELKNLREKAYSEGKKANSAKLFSIVGG